MFFEQGCPGPDRRTERAADRRKLNIRISRMLAIALIAVLLIGVLVGCRNMPVAYSDNGPDTSGTRYLGDMDNNGKLEPSDARVILRVSVGLENLPGLAKGRVTEKEGQISTAARIADVNCDGKVSSDDARLALRMAVLLEPLFAEEPIVTEPPYEEPSTEKQTEASISARPTDASTKKPTEKPTGDRKTARLLTLIDDDGHQTFYEKLLPVIREKHVPISMAIETGWAGTGTFMSWETIAECHSAGAEVLNHSQRHIWSKEKSEQRTSEDIMEEMLGSIADLEEHGYGDTADIYVYPGSSAGATWDEAMQVMRVCIRAGGNIVNTFPFANKWILSRYKIGSDHVPDFEEMKQYIDELVDSGGWEIWMMHSNNGYMTDECIEALKQAIDYCRTVGVQIVTAKDALDFYGMESQRNN